MDGIVPIVFGLILIALILSVVTQCILIVLLAFHKDKIGSRSMALAKISMFITSLMFVMTWFFLDTIIGYGSTIYIVLAAFLICIFVYRKCSAASKYNQSLQ